MNLDKGPVPSLGSQHPHQHLICPKVVSLWGTLMEPKAVGALVARPGRAEADPESGHLCSPPGPQEGFAYFWLHAGDAQKAPQLTGKADARGGVMREGLPHS